MKPAEHRHNPIGLKGAFPAREGQRMVWDAAEVMPSASSLSKLLRARTPSFPEYPSPHR
jgi:hypothetical protein